jgi:hypothetical protein
MPKQDYIKQSYTKYLVPSRSLYAKNVVRVCFSKSTQLNFDQVYTRKYQYLEYQIITTRKIMKYISIWYTFNIVDIHDFQNKFGQT